MSFKLPFSWFHVVTANLCFPEFWQSWLWHFSACFLIFIFGVVVGEKLRAGSCLLCHFANAIVGWISYHLKYFLIFYCSQRSFEWMHTVFIYLRTVLEVVVTCTILGSRAPSFVSEANCSSLNGDFSFGTVEGPLVCALTCFSLFRSFFVSHDLQFPPLAFPLYNPISTWFFLIPFYHLLPWRRCFFVTATLGPIYLSYSWCCDWSSPFFSVFILMVDFLFLSFDFSSFLGSLLPSLFSWLFSSYPSHTPERFVAVIWKPAELEFGICFSIIGN